MSNPILPESVAASFESSMAPYGFASLQSTSAIPLSTGGATATATALNATRASGGSRPLSIAHLGPCLFRGGAEQQLIDLHHFFDPNRAVLSQCLVTDANAIDPLVAADMRCPVVHATREAIAAAANENDILLFWGLKLDELLSQDTPTRAKCVYLAHGDSWWTRELLTGSRAATTHTIAVSQRVVDATCSDFPFTKIHNGVDTARLATTRSRDEVRKSLGFEPDDFVVGYVGRFSQEKRPELLIEAMAHLPKNFKALFVGWGAQRQTLMETANRQIPNRYAFASADRYLGDYYQSMDAFSLLSIQEGFALVLLEAMFCAVPIVATPVGCVPEVIVDRMNGLVVDGTTPTIVNAIMHLEDRRAWASAMGQEGQRYARRYGHARLMAERYQSLLSTLCNTSI